jgi:hypothetical protein
MKILLKESLKIVLLASIAILFVVGVTFAQTWTSPPSSPPNNNTPAPINVGSTAQTKSGNLNIGSVLLNSAGSVSATSFFYSSDRHLKNNIMSLSDESIDKILKLEGVSYIWKEDGQKDMGIIAQEIEKVYPELVKINENTGYKTVHYVGLIAPLLELTKKQKSRIDNLEERIKVLEKSIK